MTISRDQQHDARPRVDVSGGRVAPYDLDAERSLLGAMLLSRDAVGVAVERISTEAFHKPAHGHVFDAIVSLYGAGDPIDTITVAGELRRSGLLDQLGGPEFLLELESSTPAASNAANYARLIQNAALLRRLIGTAGEIAELAYRPGVDAEGALDAAEAKIFDIAQRRRSEEPQPLGVLLDQHMAHLDEIYRHGSKIIGVPTGFHQLDELMSGMHAGNLLVVGARPSMGKTSLALNIATHVGVRENRPVLIFSLEMSFLEITQRILCSEARVNSKALRQNSLDAADWNRVAGAETRLGGAQIYVDERPDVTVLDIRAKARRLKSQLGDLGLVVVDYLQLMTGRNRAENRQVEVSEISRGLKILARELEVPVIALSQLSRNLESRADKRPQLSDLRESGSIEQDADVVMFIYRDEVYNEESPDRGMAELLVAKHRNGPTGRVKVVFLGSYTSFVNDADRGGSIENF